MEDLNWVPPLNKYPDTNPSSDLPKILLHALHSTEGLKSHHLKRFYSLLIHLSSSIPEHDTISETCSTFWLLNVDPYYKVPFEDITFISNVLSEEVSKLFNQIMPISSPDSLRNDSDKATILACVEILKLLLRCYMILLSFFEKDQHKLVSHTRVLFDMLKRLVDSLHLSEPSDERVPLLCTIIEVFVDELSVSSRLREYFKLTVSSFKKGWSHDNAGIVMELISEQFCALFSHEQAFKTFIDKLFDTKLSELSLPAVGSLILNPVLFSAPKLFQAYIVSLASQAIRIRQGYNNVHPDIYLSIFQKAITLYSKNFSSIPKYNPNRQSSDYLSCIKPVTRDRIDNVIGNLDNCWRLNLHKTFSRTKSDLLASSIAYVKESSHLVINMHYKDEIISVLTQLILKASAVKVDYMSIDVDNDMPQDLYLLASSLDFVSSSFLQVLQYLVQFRTVVTSRNLLKIIQCFGKLGICSSNEKLFNDMESKMMFVHFYGLLSLSFDKSFDFLVKGCISMIAALLNFFVFEEGSLLGLQPFINDSVHGQSSENIEIGVDHSSLVLASKFWKIQKLCLSSPSSVHLKGTQLDVAPNKDNSNGSVCIEEESSETICKGDIYLNCTMGSDRRPADFDDLADFVECKKGKDYSSWVKNRERYRRQKSERRAALKWERKKKAWRTKEKTMK